MKSDSSQTVERSRDWMGRSFVRLGLLFLFLLNLSGARGSLGQSPPSGSQPRSKAKPNILIFLADDLGYSDLGCYGGEIETPSLDELARNGIRFSQFYNTARCWSSRASLLTGYYAQQVHRDKFPGEEFGGVQATRPEWGVLLSERMKVAGYHSYHSGKWHIDGAVLANGFERSYCLNDHDRHFGPHNHTLDDKPLLFDPNKPYYSTTVVADRAIEFLQDHHLNYRGDPFLEFVAFTAPHFPLQAPERDIQKYRERYQSGWDLTRRARYDRQLKMNLVSTPLSEWEPQIGPPYDYPAAIEVLGPGEVNRENPWSELNADERQFQAAKMAIHAAMVDRMDQEIGRVIEQLQVMGAFDNTIIFFLSDNGASAEIMVRGDGHDPTKPLGSADTFLSLGPGFSRVSNTPFRRHKTWVHEGGIATPLIVHWPNGGLDRGSIRHQVGHLIDIVPTLLEAAGIAADETHSKVPLVGPAGPSLPGRSLMSAIVANQPIEREFLWWLHEGNRALRVGDWKIVGGPNQAWELYDLKIDRAETQDLSKQAPERVVQLAQQWETISEGFRQQVIRELSRVRSTER